MHHLIAKDYELVKTNSYLHRLFKKNPLLRRGVKLKY